MTACSVSPPQSRHTSNHSTPSTSQPAQCSAPTSAWSLTTSRCPPQRQASASIPWTRSPDRQLRFELVACSSSPIRSQHAATEPPSPLLGRCFLRGGNSKHLAEGCDVLEGIVDDDRLISDTMIGMAHSNKLIVTRMMMLVERRARGIGC